MRIAFVAEEGFDAGGLVEEGKRAGRVTAKEVREVVRISSGLVGDLGKRHARFLCFDNAHGFAIDKQEVIAAAFLETDFADRDPAASR